MQLAPDQHRVPVRSIGTRQAKLQPRKTCARGAKALVVLWAALQPQRREKKLSSQELWHSVQGHFAARPMICGQADLLREQSACDSDQKVRTQPPNAHSKGRPAEYNFWARAWRGLFESTFDPDAPFICMQFPQADTETKSRQGQEPWSRRIPPQKRPGASIQQQQAECATHQLSYCAQGPVR